MHNLTRGILVSIEGIDGSGKSTLARSLAAAMSSVVKTVLTKEPGDTPLGQQIRTLVQEKKEPMCSISEYLLFAADRAQHFEQLVIPALNNRSLVISDRLADSSLAYQGFGRGLDCDMIEKINSWAMQHRAPDITMYVQVCPEVAYERIIKRQEQLTAFEREKKDFMRAVVAGFESIFSKRSNVWYISGEQQPEDVCNQSYQLLNQWLTANGILSHE